MQKVVIEAALEYLDFERVIRIGMYAKVFYFRQWNRLIILLLASRRWLVTLWVRSESTDIHLAGGNGPIRVDLRIREVTSASERLAERHEPRQRRKGPGTAGSSSGSKHRYQRASTRTQGASGTSRSRSPDVQPDQKGVAISTSQPTNKP
jgi:hypothetical protein